MKFTFAFSQVTAPYSDATSSQIFQQDVSEANVGAINVMTETPVDVRFVENISVTPEQKLKEQLEIFKEKKIQETAYLKEFIEDAKSFCRNPSNVYNFLRLRPDPPAAKALKILLYIGVIIWGFVAIFQAPYLDWGTHFMDNIKIVGSTIMNSSLWIWILGSVGVFIIHRFLLRYIFGYPYCVIDKKEKKAYEKGFEMSAQERAAETSTSMTLENLYDSPLKK